VTSSHGMIDLPHEVPQQGLLDLAGYIQITLDQGWAVEVGDNRSPTSVSLTDRK